MNTTSFREFKKMSSAEVKAVLPLVITLDGEPTWVLAPANSVISIGDLHPFVQKRFRAMENKVRAGMPKVDRKVFSVDTVPPEVPVVS